MITLWYSCKCGWASSMLNEAQEHANRTTHHVDVAGHLTPNLQLKTGKTEESIAQRARDSAIMRIAKERGLVK